jgi:hypothetical protein
LQEKKLFRQLKSTKIVADESFLTEDQKEYLKQAPNRQEYVDDLELMTKEVLFYSKKKEWIQMKVDFYREEVEERVNEEFLNLKLHGFL